MRVMLKLCIFPVYGSPKITVKLVPQKSPLRLVWCVWGGYQSIMPSSLGARYTRLLVPSILALACSEQAWAGPLGLDWASQGKSRWRQESCIPGA